MLSLPFLDRLDGITLWLKMKSIDQLTNSLHFWFKVYKCSHFDGSEDNHDLGMTFVTWSD
jgi:hypothetical protein